jgi:glycosyltransferase involved in cell wall biosynthesis
VLCANADDVAFLVRCGIPAARVTRYHSGVGSAFLVAGEAVRPDSRGDERVLFLGSWIPRKGTLDFAQAATRVLRTRASARVTIAGCGVGASEVLTSFPADVHTRIEVIPKLADEPATIDVMARSRIYALPSFFEGQPLSMLEAAAMRLALVCTRISGITDFVDDGVNGLLVPVGDPDALASAVIGLLADPARSAALGDAARARAHQYTWSSAAAHMLDAYRKAIRSSDSARHGRLRT